MIENEVRPLSLLWKPTGYYAVGEEIEVEVSAKVYQGQVKLSAEELGLDF